MAVWISRPRYKTLFNFLTYFGLIFSHSTCKLTLRHLFPLKSKRYIRVLHVVSIAYSLIMFATHWNVFFTMTSVDRRFTVVESWKRGNLTFTSAIVRKGGFWTIHLFGALSMMLCIYQAWSQDVGFVLQRIRSVVGNIQILPKNLINNPKFNFFKRNSSVFDTAVAEKRCIFILALSILMSFCDGLHIVLITEMLTEEAEASGLFARLSVHYYLFGSEVSFNVSKWIVRVLDISKIMMVLYRHLHIILSVNYAAQLISNIGKSGYCSKLDHKSGSESWVTVEEWKEMTVLLESINRAQGLYLLLFFPAAILFIIVSICTQYIQAFPTLLGTRYVHLLPGVWFTCRMLILMELGHILDVAVCVSDKSI